VTECVNGRKRCYVNSAAVLAESSQKIGPIWRALTASRPRVRRATPTRFTIRIPWGVGCSCSCGPRRSAIGTAAAGSTGLALEASGSLGAWSFDQQGRATQVPSWFWTLGMYADAVNVTNAQHVGPFVALDFRPRRSALNDLKVGGYGHLFWAERVQAPANRLLQLALGLRFGVLDIVSIAPFAQWDLRNGQTFSWAGLLVFDFKILRDLGVPVPKA
jgi:hypothetical protein